MGILGSDKAIAAMPEGRENFAVGAKSRFEKIKEQITLFKPGQEVAAGIEAVDTSGHTPDTLHLFCTVEQNRQ